MLDKPKGQRVNLMTARQEFDQDYAALSPEEIATLKDQAKKEQHAKKYVPKQLKRAQQHDIANVAKSFQQAVSAKNPVLPITR